MTRRKLKPRSLEREVYTVLREDVLNGTLPPGHALVEAQLASELGVSKTPVREALISLSRDGLVDITPYRGARVRVPSVDDVRQACELRIWLETQIVRKIALAPPVDLLAQLGANIDQAEAAYRSGDRVNYVAAARTFSELLIAASGNRYAQEVLDNMRNLLSMIANASRTNALRERRSIDEHRRIYEALAAGNVEQAERATRGHLEGIEEDSLRATDGLVDLFDAR